VFKTLKMEVTCFSEIMVSTCKTTQCHNPENQNLNTEILLVGLFHIVFFRIFLCHGYDLCLEYP
jgi:hypothetical protein